MNNQISAIDHLMIHVRDCEAAGALFERLGFYATPKSNMPGLSNRLVCFGDTDIGSGICNYIELMQMEDRTIAPQPTPELLVPFGPVSIVLSAVDAKGVHERLAAEGVRIGPPVSLSRDWALDGGRVVTPRFVVAIPEIGQAPIYWNYCQHLTPELYVLDEFVAHANTARGLTEVHAIADSVDDAAAHYEKHWQAERKGDRLYLPKAGPRLHLTSHADLAAAYPGAEITAAPGIKGVTIAVADIERARAIADAAGFSPIDTKTGFLVAADRAEGCFFVFEVGDA